ncbi:MAG: hypothetical protein R6X08_11630 [Desulfosalsimonadaceae bacterium]
MALYEQILYILQGPMVWVALIVFAAGLLVQSLRLWSYTRKTSPRAISFAASLYKGKDNSRARRWIRWIGQIKTTALGASPVVSGVSIIFHIFLFITPIFLMGHNLLIKTAVGISIPSFSETVSDICTLVVLFCGLFFLLRRLLARRVRALTSAYDIFLLLLALLPFATGFLARHHLLVDYRQMILLHMAAGELMLIMIPFSKFFHMIFFFFGRFFIVNEYSLAAPKRVWQFNSREAKQ